MIKSILNKPLASVEVNSSENINFDLNSISLENGVNYTNFNMGAGEEVIIALISRLVELPDYSLVLIEELELGLHPKAQKVLMEKLFHIVFAKKHQLIFTTHSPFLFDAMPPEKFILEKLKSSEEYVRSIDDSNEFCSFIANEISLDDHHGLFRVIAQEIGLSEEIVRMRVIDGLVLFFGGEFEGLKEFVESGLI